MNWNEILNNPNILNDYKSIDYLYIECDCCGKEYPQKIKDLKTHVKRGYKSKTCSTECMSRLRLIVKGNCAECGKQLVKHQKKFCSQSCSATNTNKSRPQEKKNAVLNKKTRQLEINHNCILCDESFSGNINRKFCSPKCVAKAKSDDSVSKWLSGELVGYAGKTASVKKFVRAYLFETRGSACSVCEWDERHPIDGAILTEIDHIDGDAHNCHPDNLQILCPNCHSKTPNHRARNKKSSRIR